MCVNHSKLIEIAKSLKPLSWKSHSFHVTFAFNKNHLLSTGLNKPMCSHPINLKYDYRDRDNKPRNSVIGLHSEMSALLRLGREDCSDISFYVLRIDNNGKPNMSKPCGGCMSAFRQIGFKNIYYTNKRGEFERIPK